MSDLNCMLCRGYMGQEDELLKLASYDLGANLGPNYLLGYRDLATGEMRSLAVHGKCAHGRLEALAALTHEMWAHWMTYMMTKATHVTGSTNDSDFYTFPAGIIQRWERQRDTAYHALPSSEKVSDRELAAKMLPLLGIMLDGWRT